MLHGVLEGGEATWSVDQPLRLNRRGVVEESYFTYSYSPIPDDAGIGGVLLVTVDTTERVLAERRLRTLRELATELASVQRADEVCLRAAGVLAESGSDLPFSLLFLDEAEGGFRLAASTGITETSAPDNWPLREVASSQHASARRGRGFAAPRERGDPPPRGTRLADRAGGQRARHGLSRCGPQ